MTVKLSARSHNFIGWCKRTFNLEIPVKYLVGFIVGAGLIAATVVVLQFTPQKPPLPHEFDAYLTNEYRAYAIPPQRQADSYDPTQITLETKTPGVKACLLPWDKLGDDIAEVMEKHQQVRGALYQGIIDKEVTWSLNRDPKNFAHAQYVLILSNTDKTDHKVVHVTVSYGRD